MELDDHVENDDAESMELDDHVEYDEPPEKIDLVPNFGDVSLMDPRFMMNMPNGNQAFMRYESLHAFDEDDVYEVPFELEGEDDSGENMDWAEAVDDIFEFSDEGRVVDENTQLSTEHMRNMLADTSDIVQKNRVHPAHWNGESCDAVPFYFLSKRDRMKKNARTKFIAALPKRGLLARPSIGDSGMCHPNLFSYSKNNENVNNEKVSGAFCHCSFFKWLVAYSFILSRVETEVIFLSILTMMS